MSSCHSWKEALELGCGCKTHLKSHQMGQTDCSAGCPEKGVPRGGFVRGHKHQVKNGTAGNPQGREHNTRGGSGAERAWDLAIL